MKKFILTLLILLAICTAFFFALSIPRGMGDEQAIAGVLDLTRADFSQTRYNLDGEWEFFFNALYTPEDFANDTTTDGSLIEVPGSWHYAGYPRHGFATYRLTIKTYEPSLMILLPQITSASIVWVNGVKVLEAGTISTDPPGEEHGAVNIFVPFSPVDGQVEIVIQAANFTWFSAGLRNSIEMGTPEHLIRDAVFRRVVLALFIGMLFAIFLYHILLFVYYRNEWVYLAFAVFCFLTAVVFILETDGLLHLFWGRSVILRDLLQIVVVLAGAAFNVFTHLALRIPIGKIRGFAYGVLFGIPVLTVIFLPSYMIDSRIVFIAVLSAPILFVSILRYTTLKGNYKYLLLITTAVFFIGQPFNRLFFDEHTYYMFLATPHLFVVLSHFLLLSVSFSEEKRAALETREINNMLARLNHLKSDFLANISHEIKTPLSVMDVYAQLTKKHIKMDRVSDGTMENLSTISAEAKRLAVLVEQLLDVSVAKENAAASIRVLVQDIFSQVRTLCEPIVRTNENVLEIYIEKDCPPVLAKPDMIKQIFFNLASNANRHTKNGTIELRAESGKKDGVHDGMIVFTVRDNGKGIQPKILDAVFQKGISGDGSSGLGLPICKEAIEAHGGTIHIESELSIGTTITFTLPVYKE